MKSRLSRLLALFALCLVPTLSLFAAWRPGLRCGFHTQGEALSVPPIWTGTALDTVAATNYEKRCRYTDAPVTTNFDGTGTSLWSTCRMWRYWGQIYLEAGEVTFGGSIDDFLYLEIDGELVVRNGKATQTYETAGWHDFLISFGDNQVFEGGGAGPNSGTGLDKTGFGFAIKEKGATTWSYPADDGTMKRYRYDDGTGFPDILEVSASPIRIGTVEPPYGQNRGYAAGDHVACSAPSSFEQNGTRGTLLGYVVTTNFHARGEYLRGTAASFDYVHVNDIAFLDWKYAVEHKIDIQASPGGALSRPGGWCEHGSVLTVEAIPGDGAFVGWAGDLPASADPANPVLAFTVDRPRSITAIFRASQLSEKLYTGPSDGNWNEPGNWLPAGIPSLSDAVHVPAGKRVAAPSVVYAGSLTLSNSAAISFAGDTTARNAKVNFLHNGMSLSSFLSASDRGRKADRSLIGDSFTIQVAHDVTLLDKAELLVGGHFMTTRPEVEIGGKLTLQGQSKADFYAGESQLFYERDDYGAKVTVGGALTIGKGAVVALYNHLGEPLLDQPTRNGSSAAVFLEAGETVIEKGGLLCAYSGLTDMTVPRPVWEDSCGGAHFGGAHGGRGGNGGSPTSKPPYKEGRPPTGNLLAPVLPGPFGRFYQTIGGGVVRLQTGRLVLDGTIDASATFLFSLWEAGGPAGGSIWLLCDSFECGVAGRLVARGYKGAEYNNHNCGGGSGGRIAVAVGLSPEQIHSLATTGAAEGLSPIGDMTISHGSHIDVSGGPGAFAGGFGGPGTAVYYSARRAGAFSLDVGVDPVSVAAAAPVLSPSLGISFHDAGSALTASAPASVDEVAGLVRRPCIGYALLDASGAVLSEGTGTTCAIPAFDQDMKLVWRYDDPRYRVSVSSSAGGEVEGDGWYREGEIARIVTASASGAPFKTWLSSVFLDRRSLLEQTLSFEVVQPLSLAAAYGAETPARTARCYTGPADGSWDDPGNWTPVGVPSIDSDVYLPEKAVVDLPVHALVGSLTVSNGAVLSVFGKNTVQKETLPILPGSSKAILGREALDFEATDLSAGLGVVDSIDLLGNARLTVGGFSQFRPSEITVGGDIRMKGSSVLEIYSGPTNTTSVTTRSGGARILVGGTFLVDDESTVEVFGHLPMNSVWPQGRIGPATIEAGSFRLGPSALLRGVVGSSGWTHLTEDVLSKHSEISGAGHGGQGGASGTTPGGAAYDAPYAPLLPGASGRPVNNFGGGAIRLHAKSISLDGTVDVSGCRRAVNNWERGGASGGSIWLTAGEWRIGPAAALLAGGMKAHGYGPQHVRGGGAGGRIALGRNLTPADLDALYATGDGRRGLRKTNLLEDSSFFPGTIDVAGGAGFSPGGEPGEDGTAWLLDGTPSGTVLMVR